MYSIGLTIPQRAALFGAGTPRELMRLAPIAESSGLIDTIWVGDSLTSKARTEAIATLGTLAGLTERVRLAVGCLATLAIRDPALLALQWASLDQLSEGRMLLAVCNGLQKRDGASAKEGAHFGGVPDQDRVRRLEEFTPLLRQLWTGKPVSFDGRFVRYDDITLELTPVQDPCPVWLSANPPPGPAAARVLRRAAKLADGLITIALTPSYLRDCREQLLPLVAEQGRDPDTFPVAAYHSINVGPDRAACLEEARRFYDHYYGEGFFDADTTANITAAGPAGRCVEDLRHLLNQGVSHITLRLASWRQREQLDIVLGEVLPALAAGLTGPGAGNGPRN